MNLVDLALLYLLAGCVFAVASFLRQEERDWRAVGKALASIAVWPFWAPLVLSTSERREHRDSSGLSDSSSSAERIEAALAEGLAAAHGTPFESLLNRAAVEGILREVRRSVERRQEIAALLRRSEFSLERARQRVEILERQGATPRALASARLRLQNVERLLALQQRDGQALEELGDLSSALRTQLVLARHAGSSLEGVGGIVSEVWARVEGLSDAMNPELSVDPFPEPTSLSP